MAIVPGGADVVQISDKELPKPRWQQKAERGAPKTNEYGPPREENALKRKREEAEQDPKLKEFLEAYVPPSKTSIWANADAPLSSAPVPMEDAVPEVVVPAEESDGEYQVIAKKAKSTQEPRDGPTAKQLTPEAGQMQEEPENVSHVGDAMEDVQDAPPMAEQGPVTDDDWLRSRTNRVLDLVDDDEMPPTSAPEPQADVPDSPEPAVKQSGILPPAEAQVSTAVPSEEDKIRETGRLYLRNLHFDVTEDELRLHFSKYGPLEEVRTVMSLSFTRFVMNIKIGTTDALHMRLTWRIF